MQAVVSGGKFVSKLTANVANSRNGLKLMDYKKFGESVRAGEAELEALRQTILKMRAEGQGMGAIQDKFRGTALDGLDEAALDKFCAADTLEKKVGYSLTILERPTASKKPEMVPALRSCCWRGESGMLEL